MLAIALKAINALQASPLYSIEVIIVDNDERRTAEEIVGEYAANGRLNIIYDCEGEKSIPLARNRSIRNANGNFVAIIDDDEFPESDWLDNLYRCLKKSGADGVLGPVLPHFPSNAPDWLEKSGLCERPRSATGSIVKRGLRTGNILLRRSIFASNEKWFDTQLRLCGGSDGDFLLRQIEKGCTFIWCDDAIVYETVPKERWSAQFYLRRYFRIGVLIGDDNRRLLRIWEVFRNMAFLAVLAAILPLSSIAGEHHSLKILTKISYHAGCILSFFSLTEAQEKE